MRIDLLIDNRRSQGAQGFTLLEVLIAFTICAFALAGFLQVFSTSATSAGRAEETTIATLLAESKLAAAGDLLPLDGTVLEGAVDGGFRWRIESAPLEDALDRPGQGPLAAYHVQVAVSWGSLSRQRSVSLTSLRLVRRE